MREKLTELQSNFPAASDDSESQRARYCVRTLPRTFVLDSAGVIRSVIEGEGVHFGERLESALRDLGVGIEGETGKASSPD